MKIKIKIFIFCSIFLLFTALATVAQEKQGKDKKVSDQESTLMEDKPEDRTAEGGFVYKPRGRRDPFWDLLRGKEAKMLTAAKEGIAGLEIDQLELEGIIYRSGQFIALFKGPKGNPYDVQVGQNVYDGEIIQIDANRVVFKKILTIALGGTKEKTVVKTLEPEEEKEK
jgi:Tfp pilus assembly protein PilP